MTVAPSLVSSSAINVLTSDQLLTFFMSRLDLTLHKPLLFLFFAGFSERVGYPEHSPLDIRPNTFAAHTSDTLNRWAVPFRHLGQAPCLDSRHTRRANCQLEGVEATSNLNGFVESKLVLHRLILARFSIFERKSISTIVA